MTTTTLSPDEIKLEMRRRLRRYMGSVLLMLLAVFTAPLFVGFVLKLAGLGDNVAGPVALVLGFGGLLTVVGLSWRLVFKLWRCPGCEKSVFMVVSWNTSVFAPMARKVCPHCSAELFDKRSSRRTLLLILIFALLGVFGAVASTLMSKRERQAVPTPATGTQQP